MEELSNIISAEELFGAASRLAEQGFDAKLSNIASLGVLYQIAAGIVAMASIFVLIKGSDIVRHLIILSVNGKFSSSDTHIYSSEIKNIEIYTSIIGILFLSLCAMRLSILEGAEGLFSQLGALPSWGIGGVALCGICITILLELIMLYAAGVASERHDACNAIWQIKQLHFSTTIILLAPMLILMLLSEGVVAKIALYISVAICSVSLILFIKETFLLFRAQRFSIFHWILYLCALEIFPLSLLLAPILRG